MQSHQLYNQGVGEKNVLKKHNWQKDVSRIQDISSVELKEGGGGWENGWFHDVAVSPFQNIKSAHTTITTTLRYKQTNKQILKCKWQWTMWLFHQQVLFLPKRGWEVSEGNRLSADWYWTRVHAFKVNLGQDHGCQNLAKRSSGAGSEDNEIMVLIVDQLTNRPAERERDRQREQRWDRSLASCRNDKVCGDQGFPPSQFIPHGQKRTVLSSRRQPVSLGVIRTTV